MKASKTSRGPLVYAFVFGVLSVLVGWVAWSFVVDLRLWGLHEACKGNLKGVEIALKAYAESNGGHLPASLSVLVDQGHIHESRLRCQASGETYIYFFEGMQVSTDQLHPLDCLVADRGFPHRISRKARSFKHLIRWRGDYSALTMEDFFNKLEEDPGELQRLLKSLFRSAEKQVAD